MKRCIQCHGKLGLGVRSRNVWNGRWWIHVLYCSTHCEALHELERNDARRQTWPARMHISRQSAELTERRLPFTSAWFSRAEQRFLQAIFKAIAEGGGKCVAILAMLARNFFLARRLVRLPLRSVGTIQ